MQNLSKKHLKQIYRRRNGFGGATVMLSKFFRAAPNNRADYNKMMDWRWSGAMANGVRLYSPDEWRWGLALLTAAAWFGALSAWRIRETRCRNIWSPPA